VQYKHVSPVAVAAILAAGEIAITLLEVPTGRFADRYGHRRSLILGSAIQVAAMLLCWLAEGVSGLVLASLCVALGDTFRSGADQALLFESCVAAGRPQRFQQIEAKTHSLGLIGLVVMMVAGGILVETIGFAAAWIAETVLAASGVAIALAMVSPPPTPPRSPEVAAPAVTSGAAVRLLRLIVPAALIGGAASATAFTAQTGESATPMQLTVLVSAITLAEAAGAAAARSLRADVATQYFLLTACAFVVAMMAVAHGFFLAGVVTLSVLAGAAAPLRATAIQLVADRRRAEAASSASALDGAIRTLALMMAGYLNSTC
jgi:MFS family permease